MLQDIGRTSGRGPKRYRGVFAIVAAALDWLRLCSAVADAAVQSRVAKLPASLEQWDIFEIELDGPTDGNPFLDVELSGTFETDGEKQTVARLLRRRRRVPHSLHAEQAGPVEVHDAEQQAGTRRQERRVRSRRADRQQPRPGAREEHVPLRLRRRHAVSATRHHLLRLDAPGRRARGANAQDARRVAVQQDPHVRLPQAVHLEPERAAALRRSRARRRTSGTSRGSTRSSFSIWNSGSPSSATWASKPTSFCCIPTTKGIGASTACRTKSTIAI